MKFNTQELRAGLIEKTRINLNKVEGMKSMSLDTLNKKENPEKWSALECIEHLNLYGDFYNPEIKQRIASSKSESRAIFKSGLLGNYFANSMQPKEKLNKMKTFKDKNPSGSLLNINVLDRFIQQQKEFLDLLEKSKQIDLTKTKTSLTISKMIKLRLGDTFRFVTAHNDRHILQAEKAIEGVS